MPSLPPPPDAPPTGRNRAAALPPDERRTAILDAVVPLLVAHGAGVTTRQMAEAAGVAEGTLFRVFDDKAALLHAAAHAVLDPERGRRALAEIDAGLTLDAMVATVVEQQLQRLGQAVAVLMAVRSSLGPGEAGAAGRSGPPAFVVESHRALLQGLTELFARYRDQLSVEPERAALLLRALLFGSRTPWADPSQQLSGDEIAATLVHGVTTCTPSPTTASPAPTPRPTGRATRGRGPAPDRPEAPCSSDS